MVMVVLTLQETGPWRVVYVRGGKLWSVRQDGTDVRVESGAPPNGVVSPDGKRCLYVDSNEGDAEIWVSDVDGKNARKLTDNKALDNFPGWTADGKRIVFASTRSGRWQIWIMEADGKNPVRLTDHADGAQQPCVSPEGDRIAYLELHPAPQKLPPSTLRIMDLATRESKIVIEKSQILGASWSPKGGLLACSLVQELRVLEIPSNKVAHKIKFEDVHKELYAHAAYGIAWRPDGGAVACTIQFLGGRMEGAEVFGDDQIFLLPFGGKPAIIEAGGPAGPVRWEREKR